MSISKAAKALRSARLKRNDRTWFERWIGWYGKFCGKDHDQPVPVERALVIGFLRKQKSAGRQS